jgi:hypothetical protein
MTAHAPDRVCVSALASGGLGRTPEAGRPGGWFCHSPRNVRAGSVIGRRDLDDLGVTNPAVGCNLRSLPAGQVRGQILPAYRRALCGFPGPYRCPGRVRICRRSELSSAAAITVIVVTATGAGKPASSAAS